MLERNQKLIIMLLGSVVLQREKERPYSLSILNKQAATILGRDHKCTSRCLYEGIFFTKHTSRQEQRSQFTLKRKRKWLFQSVQHQQKTSWSQWILGGNFFLLFNYAPKWNFPPSQNFTRGRGLKGREDWRNSTVGSRQAPKLTQLHRELSTKKKNVNLPFSQGR